MITTNVHRLWKVSLAGILSLAGIVMVAAPRASAESGPGKFGNGRSGSDDFFFGRFFDDSRSFRFDDSFNRRFDFGFRNDDRNFFSRQPVRRSPVRNFNNQFYNRRFNYQPRNFNYQPRRFNYQPRRFYGQRSFNYSRPRMNSYFNGFRY